MNKREMFNLAKEVANNAYSPYSNFMVGATLLTKSGKIYTGCNIENQGIQSICSERVAFAKALSEGEREFEAIFCKPDFEVYSYNEENNEIKKYTLQELLPYGFTL